MNCFESKRLLFILKSFYLILIKLFIYTYVLSISASIEMCQQLCEQFGGEFIRVDSNNITGAIAKTAEKYFITQVTPCATLY